MKKNKEIKIIEINSKKIILKTNNSWAFCLNANQEKFNYFSLKNEELEIIKLKKVCELKENDNKNNHIFNKNNLELRDYQKEDIEFLSKIKCCAIFSEMRTGKTPIALNVFKRWKIRKLLIIVPTILQKQWQESVKKWLNKPSYIISLLNKKNRLEFYENFILDEEIIIIVSKDIFKIDGEDFKKFFLKNLECVIIDEAHFLRNPNSKQSKSIYFLKNLEYKIILTGTPIVNHNVDIFGILKFIKPNLYYSYWKFANSYFNIEKIKIKKDNKDYFVSQIKDFKNKEEAKKLKKEIESISVNRRQKEVLLWLPEKIYRKEYLLMQEKQRELYFQILEERNINEPLETLSKLKTLTLCPEILGIEEEGAKISYLINFVKEKEEENLIIFSTRSDTFLIPLSKKFENINIFNFGIITGKTNYKEREEKIDQFQKGIIKILLCNIKSANLGINLSKAKTIIFADRSYSPADNEQAESRFIPTSNNENKGVRLIIDLICEKTIDDKIIELLKKKISYNLILKKDPSFFFN